MWDRKAGKVSKPFLFNIGLLCSKTFDDAIFPELFEAKYGLKKQDMVKMNIKGVFQIWMKDGSYHEINLKECHQWTREGCKHCPDFAAEHADISTGGIGEDNDWTLTIVRTELGEEVIERMIADGVIISRPAQEDETAMRLLRTLSIVSRRRWPKDADPAPTVGVPPPKKKAAAVAPPPPERRGRPTVRPTDAPATAPATETPPTETAATETPATETPPSPRPAHLTRPISPTVRSDGRKLVHLTQQLGDPAARRGGRPWSRGSGQRGRPARTLRRSGAGASAGGLAVGEVRHEGLHLRGAGVDVVIASSSLASPRRSSSSLLMPSMTSSMQSCCAWGSGSPPGTVSDTTMSLATAFGLGLLVQAPSRPIEATAATARVVRRRRITGPRG